MRSDEAEIVTPCTADWKAMTPVEARQRLCAACDKVVHDLSAMADADARRALRSGPICVRYVQDIHGNILHGDLGHATIVPISALTAARRRLGLMALAATTAVTALVFEACGGTAGDFDDVAEPDAGPDATPPHVFPPDAGVPDATDADGG